MGTRSACGAAPAPDLESIVLEADDAPRASPAPPCGLGSFIDMNAAGYHKNTDTSTPHGMVITPENQGNNFCKNTADMPTGHAAGEYAELVYCSEDDAGNALDAPYCVPVATASAVCGSPPMAKISPRL